MVRHAQEEHDAAAAAAHHAALDSRLRRETPFLASIRFKNDLPEVTLWGHGRTNAHCRSLGSQSPAQHVLMTLASLSSLKPHTQHSDPSRGCRVGLLRIL